MSANELTPPLAITTQELARLVDLHLDDLKCDNPNWQVCESPISGRGLFARRDIQPGELLFRERTLLVGPTAHKKSKTLNTCIVCYRKIATNDETDVEALCPAGCALPVCATPCSESAAHAPECALLRQWQPVDLTHNNPNILRIVAVMRCLLLDEPQRRLLYAMQANADRYYVAEIERAAASFQQFPQDPEVLKYLHRVVCVINTNAFEGRSTVEGNETQQRALYPLSGLMNHSCMPNAAFHYLSANEIEVTATAFIPQGAEITITYTKLLWGTLMRKLFLRMTKNFVCACARCQDPTENGTNLSALLCRAPGCKGIVIPIQTKTMQPDWRCTTCEHVFPHAKMARYQDFALNTINNRINTSSIKDMIHFINDLCPRFCPSSNYVLIEAKLNVIWRMQRGKQEYTADQLEVRDRYREEILAILKQLGAGECTLKKLITKEIE